MEETDIGRDRYWKRQILEETDIGRDRYWKRQILRNTDIERGSERDCLSGRNSERDREGDGRETERKAEL